MFPVALPEGPHPFPYRTRKLSPPRPMILLPRGSGKVGRCRVSKGPTREISWAFSFCNPWQRPEESRWVLSADIDYDTAIKSQRYAQARFGPLPGFTAMRRERALQKGCVSYIHNRCSSGTRRRRLVTRRNTVSLLRKPLPRFLIRRESMARILIIRSPRSADIGWRSRQPEGSSLFLIR